jgi:arsenite-transporting ATPase
MDSTRTTLVLVARLEQSALREAANTSRELRAIGVANQCLILNGVLKNDTTGDAIAAAFTKREQAARTSMTQELVELPCQEILLSAKALLGVAALRNMFQSKAATTQRADSEARAQRPQPLLSIINELETSGKGVIMTMGKGGVGKTSIAAAIAVELAKRGHAVRLSTTDPAAHLLWVVENPVPNLTISRIDPAAETKSYQREIMQSAGENLDEQGRALLDEDLRSPCTEEVAVFRSFANIVAEGQDSFVVLDTAPTGHTILLLDAAQAYHKEVLRQSSNMPDTVINLLPRLRDPDFTRILIITLPEATPVHEAKHLQEDLARADIHPFAWIINQSLSASQTTNPILQARRNNEQEYIAEVEQLSQRVAVVPWLAEPPSDTSGLEKMLGSAPQALIR